MEILDFILEERLILIPCLYIIGSVIKNTQSIKDKYIPIILVIIGIILSIFMGGNTIINNLLQGILVAGATVLTNQLVVQKNKEK